MKLSRKVLLIVIVIAIVAALAVLYSVYARQAAERSDLNERLSRAQTLLPGLVNNRENKEDELTQAESSLEAKKVKFPESVESIEYGEYIFEIVEDCDLTLATLNFPKPSAKTEGSVKYSVVSLSLPVSGALNDIFEFIDIIKADARFASTRVKTISLNVGGGSATISVDIYGYKG
jgi:hypothetical protein